MVLSSERNQLSSLLRRAAAICTHWRTVCSVKSCGSWNDLPSPRRKILRGAMAVTSRPSKYTLPLDGARYPVQMLMKVVLPAPFCPITASRSPSCNSNSMLSAATTPPKARYRPVV
ncbi:hypothetical protein G6F45_014119 [Rhizopus arrhizus]|nr:hypothetical protein G6F45_014119 [Rhizopus arrhizus]